MSSLDTFYAGGPKTWNEAFPPICLTTHWDPTALTNHVLPQPAQRNLALDPRPSTKICTAYYDISAGDGNVKQKIGEKPLPIPAALLGINAPSQPKHTPGDYAAFPPGGAASLSFPYSVYKTHVNAESDLQRLDEPLTKCAERRYIPRGGLPAPDMSTNTLPNANLGNSTTLSPSLTVVNAQAMCRNEDDQANWERSARLFFNPTRYDRTTNTPKNLYWAEARSELLCPK
jgi:hypothetical protein